MMPGEIKPRQGAMALEVVGLSKRFGDVAALENVSLSIPPGGFHALLGENGAGKSTLVKCLVGYYQADAGQILVDDRETEIFTPRDSSRLGIGMIYQHFTLAPGMTVAENLVLARGALPAFINWREEREKLSAFMSTLPFSIALDKQAGSLAAGEKQKVEIIKQLYLQRRLLIMDEPTSVLTPGEADEVLGFIRELARQKRLTALMITHKFREVTAYADDFSVLRKGRLAGGGVVGEVDIGRMAEMMVGSPPANKTLSRNRQQPDRQAMLRLRVSNLKARDDHGLPLLKGVSLKVRAGEILGIAGVSGNGQKELVEILLGQRQATAGTVFVNGEEYTGTRAQIARHRVYSLPEEPLRNACVANLSVAENMAFRNYDRVPVARFGMLRHKALRQQAQHYVEAFNVKTDGIDAPMHTLSGGNVQRAVLARELSHPVDLLIVANPVFGLDFNAVAETHRRLLAVRAAGTAILLVSEDLDELLELADRIAVMSEGVIAYETEAVSADVRILGQYMAGGCPPAEVFA